MRCAGVVAILGVLLAVAAPSASAADPGRWRLSAVDRIPLDYGRGLAPDGAGNIFWSGDGGVFRGGEDLVERLHLVPAIPGFVRSGDGLNAIGDPTWDPGQGGRLLLPLRCGSGCRAGAIAVMDRMLLWRYRVLLAPASAAAPVWAEVAPDGDLVWTSSGRDLLAYRAAEIAPQAGRAGAPGLGAARRIAGVVPAGDVVGGAFQDGRLFLALGGSPQRVWSIDVREGQPPDARVEIERSIAGRAAGLGSFDGRGGLLHWTIAPSGRAPTYGAGRAALLTFLPSGEAALRLTVRARELRAGRPATLTARVQHRFAGRTRPVEGARVSAGSWTARTGADGLAELRVRPRSAGALRVRAGRHELASDETTLQVLPAIGGALTGLPRARVSAGAGTVTLTARRFVDCSGSEGCEAVGRPAPRGCVPLGGGDLRITLFRPPRDVSVLMQGPGDARRYSGLAQPGGRQGLGWRFRLGAARGGTGRLELLLVYADGTGALFAARTRPGRC